MSRRRKKTRFKGVFQVNNEEGTTYFIRSTFNCPITKKTHERTKTISDVSLIEAEHERIQLYKKLKDDVLNNIQSNHRLSNKTFKEYSNWYFKFVLDGKIRSEGTVIRDKSMYKHMLCPLLGHQKLSSLTREHIRWWIAEVQNLRVKGVDLYSEETFKKAFRLLKAMLNTAHREGIIKNNIVSNIRVKFEDGLPRKKKQSLTFDEVNKILSVSQSDIQFNTYFSLAVSCGMRVGELISLQWKDVDFEKNTISVCKSYSLNILQNKVKNGKNFTLPLPDIARDRLLKLYEDTKDHFNPLKLVFKSKITGKYISPNHINRKLKKYCKEAQIDKSISNHSLRYTCNTLLYTSGVAPAVIQKILNHRSGDLISTHYISIDDDVKKEIVDNIWNI